MQRDVCVLLWSSEAVEIGNEKAAVIAETSRCSFGFIGMSQQFLQEFVNNDSGPGSQNS